jgi:peptidoglycan-N-acetylglucosamine deacetylase
MHTAKRNAIRRGLDRRALLKGGVSLLSAFALGQSQSRSAAAYRPVTMPSEDAFAAASRGASVLVKRIALTFDDGNYSTSIGRLLDLLESEGVPATFFPIGYWTRDCPALFRRISERFELGNHTLNHVVLTRVTAENARADIVGGVKSPFLRPPFGATNAQVRAIADSLGMRIILWDVDSRDWTGISAAQITSNVVNGAGDGKIVLMHMGYPNTVQALPGIIAQLRARGYQFVTVSTLLNVGSPSPSTPAGAKAPR